MLLLGKKAHHNGLLKSFWHLSKQWQKARANRRMHSRRATTKMATKKATFVQLPVERYLAALPTLRQGVIPGVLKNKGIAPWAITRAEKLQLSVFLPNDLSLDDWYDFHYLRKKYDVLRKACGATFIHNDDFYSSILTPKGLVGVQSLREERLFTNRSNRPGDMATIWKMNFVLMVIP